jgi:hypothetical protein
MRAATNDSLPTLRTTQQATLSKISSADDLPVYTNNNTFPYIKMFLFKCCQQFQSGTGYEIQRGTSTDFHNSVQELSPSDLNSDKLSIRKIKKSQYEEVLEDLKRNNKKFIDQEFPAQGYSLGNI